METDGVQELRVSSRWCHAVLNYLTLLKPFFRAGKWMMVTAHLMVMLVLMLVLMLVYMLVLMRMGMPLLLHV